MKLIVLLSFILSIGIVQGQTNDSKYLIVGTVVDGSTNQPLSGAHIVSSNKLANKTDSLGEFSISSNYNDTLKISFIGYKTLRFVVPKNEVGKYLTKFKLFKDSISLNTVEILPWPTYKEFKEAFSELNFTENKIEMKGVKLYQDRNITPMDYHLGHLITNPLSFLYDKLLDKKAKTKRRIDRRRSTIEKSSKKNSIID